jgi:hypothetical protein
MILFEDCKLIYKIYIEWILLFVISAIWLSILFQCKLKYDKIKNKKYHTEEVNVRHNWKTFCAA